MPLSAGTRIGHYEVLSLVGEGGMGEVYRAHDTDLKRDVALKVLSPQFSGDPDRMGRFQREAEVLASLNHPNIATLYGTAEADGVRALAMEFVEGETLQCPQPVETALGYAKQIAEALEYAHERGVIHRDLKPGNIKITPEGVLKLLDFGLAKAIDDPQTTAASEVANSPTLTLGHTVAGVILGTAAYMSPEQVNGIKADRRADIWSFGAVLFEMLSGQRAFQGTSNVDTLASVMKVEPDWGELPKMVPTSIQALVRRCLVKDRKQRLQAIGEARIVLANVGQVPDRPEMAQVGNLRHVPWIFAALATVIAGAALWGWLKPVPTEVRPVVRVTTPLPVLNVPGAIAFSHDGSRIAFVGGPAPGQIFVRSMDQLETRPLAGTEAPTFLCFSPDGQYISFIGGEPAAQGHLRRVALAGGPVQTLAEVATRVGPPTQNWAEDDNIYFANAGALMRIPSTGGKSEILATPHTERGERFYYGAQLLPGGRDLLVGVLVAGKTQIVALNLQTGALKSAKTLLNGDGMFQFVHAGASPTTGHIVYFAAATGSVLAVPFDAGRLEAKGSPVPVLEGVQGFNTSPFALLGISESGTLVYVPGVVTQETGSTLVWVDRKGTEQPVGAPRRNYSSVRMSPTDSQRIATSIFTDTADIWVYDVARGTLDRITSEGKSQLPIWTPDGKRVIYERTPASNKPAVLWAPADRSGPPAMLTSREKDPIVPSSVSPDGKLVIGYYPLETGLWVLPLPEGATKDSKPQSILESQFRKATPEFSPDGHWVAYIVDDTGRLEVYVAPYPGPGPKFTISIDGGSAPRWSRNGRELFYRSGNNRSGQKMMAVDVQLSPTFHAGRPKVLFEGSYSSYDVTADGQRFLMVKPPAAQQTSTGQGPAVQATMVFNWFEELRRRVPLPK
jgi:Tol biopolymer transport system component